MPFDGYFLHCVCGEIKDAVDAQIYKIYQPSREELVLALRKKGFNKKLLISARGGMSRIHFTENAPENPETPPMFCMLIRKYFSGAKFISVLTHGFERVVELVFSATNEMGDKENLKIICEVMGNNSNIILARENGRIIDAVRRGGIENAGRLIAPGGVYELPSGAGKKNIISGDVKDIAEAAFYKGGLLSSSLVCTAEGMSPLVAREIAYRACLDDISTENREYLPRVQKELDVLKQRIISGGEPYILYDGENLPKDFSFFEIKQYGKTYKLKKQDSFSSLLDTFYYEKERAALQKRAGGDLERLLKNLLLRAERRKNTRIKELSAAADREKLLLYGELIKANIHAVTPGGSSVRVLNYYDEAGGYIDIPLDPALSAASNAAKYFKEYRKSRNAEQTLKEFIENDEKEIMYLDSVAFALQNAKRISEINEIREELISGGYIKSSRKNGARQKKKSTEVLSFESDEGYRILVGKNNIQNDYITTVLAQKNDLWFHVKNIPGSHVVVISGGGKVSEKTVKQAAMLAAKNSKAAASSNVPVDYTPVKYVKKPSGAKAGMVIYTTNKTIYVTPGEEI